MKTHLINETTLVMSLYFEFLTFFLRFSDCNVNRPARVRSTTMERVALTRPI